MFNNKPKKNEVYFGYIDDKVAYLRVHELSYTKRDNYVVHGTIIIPFQKQNEILIKEIQNCIIPCVQDTYSSSKFYMLPDNNLYRFESCSDKIHGRMNDKVFEEFKNLIKSKKHEN